MKFAAIITTMLHVGTTLAVPFLEQHDIRTIKPEGQRHSRSIIKNGTIATEDTLFGPAYESSWAGAVRYDSGYKTVTGTFTVPTPKMPSGGKSSTMYSSAIWVGIDGTGSCHKGNYHGLLQAGINIYIQDGKARYDAWYEWPPAPSQTFNNFPVKAGDRITVIITATSETEGSIEIKNLSTGKNVAHWFSGETKHKLCRNSVEWIVEDYHSSGLVPFANFDKVEFTDCSATTDSGSTVGVHGSQIYDIKQGKKIVTDCSTSGNSEVTCKYI